MKFTKRGRIFHRIVKLNDIMEIAYYLSDLAKEQGGKCTFEANFYDNSSVEDSDPQILDYPFTRKKDAKYISMEYISAGQGNAITIKLGQGFFTAFESDYYLICSRDEAWFKSACAEIANFANGIEKHSFFRRMFSVPWVFLTYIGSQVLLWKTLPFLGMSFGERPVLADGSPDPQYAFISAGAFYLIRMLSFAFIAFVINVLYPEQEFAFGDLRYQKRLKARKVCAWILGTILVPIVLSFFF